MIIAMVSLIICAVLPALFLTIATVIDELSFEVSDHDSD